MLSHSEYVVYAVYAVLCNATFFYVLFKTISTIKLHRSIKHKWLLFALYLCLNFSLLVIAIDSYTFLFEVHGIILRVIETASIFALVYVFLARISQGLTRWGRCVPVCMYYGCWIMLCATMILYFTTFLLQQLGIASLNDLYKLAVTVSFVSFLYIAVLFLLMSYELYRVKRHGMFCPERLLSLFFVCKMLGMLEYSVANMASLYIDIRAEFKYFAIYVFSVTILDQLAPSILILMLISKVRSRRSGADESSLVRSPNSPSTDGVTV